MGPLRSLYEQESDLERALLQQSSMAFRPVQMSDCGERCKHSSECIYSCMQPLLVIGYHKNETLLYCANRRHQNACLVRVSMEQIQRTRPSWKARR